jgi:hypothetical protein
MLHGRLLAGLAAQAIEQEHGDPDLQPARLTVELFKAAGFEPLTVETTLVRAGRRIRVADVVITSAGTPVARASAVLLRRGEQPDVEFVHTPNWDVPSPDELVAASPPMTGPLSAFEMVLVPGTQFGEVGQKQVWVRDTITLVEGVALSPFARAAMAADLASPLGNSGGGGVSFINADITLYLARSPRGEWTGLQTTGHLSAAGVAVVHSTLFDVDGPVGYAATSAVANPPLQTTR